MDVGDLVYSKAGRDKDAFFVVINKPNEKYCEISDGKTHKIDNPKLKKDKHLARVGRYETITCLFEQEDAVTNKQIRKAITEVVANINY